MIKRYRCPSCYQEFENSTGDNICPHCKVPAFLIGQRAEPVKLDEGKEIDDMEPKAAQPVDKK